MPTTADPARNHDATASGLMASYDYANYFEAGFSRDEILLRFAQAYDGATSHADRARIVMTPSYARALLLLLQGTMARFDAVQQLFEDGADDDDDGAGELGGSGAGS